MNRLQRNCVVASAGLHGLLLAILFLGPAFVSARPQPAVNLPVLRVIPDRLIDAPFQGGGSPRVQTPPVVPPVEKPQPIAPPARPSQPEPEPPTPKPEPERQPEPAPPRPAPTPRPSPADMLVKESPAPSSKSSPRKIEISREVVKRTNVVVRAEPSTATRRRSESTARERREQQERLLSLANQIEGTVAGSTKNLAGNLSGSTEIDFPGPGGAAYANWRQAVMSLYYDAWLTPDGLDNDQAVVRVEVQAARDGRILSQRILQRSRVLRVDRSVEDALDRVRLRGLPPFPAESPDMQRTFRINFNLETKRMLG